MVTALTLLTPPPWKDQLPSLVSKEVVVNVGRILDWVPTTVGSANLRRNLGELILGSKFMSNRLLLTKSQNSFVVQWQTQGTFGPHTPVLGLTSGILPQARALTPWQFPFSRHIPPSIYLI